MSTPRGEGKPTKNTASWLVPVTITGFIGLAAIWQGYEVATSAQKNQQALEVAKLKAEIIASAKTYDFRTSQMLLEHSLKPLDAPASYVAFERDFMELLAEKVPENPNLAPKGPVVKLSTPEPPSISDTQLLELVSEFKGADRLTNSDKLIQVYEERPKALVDALINGLLPPENKWSYRTNLYIVFTLARIRPGWHGSQEQFEKIRGLRDTSNYKDPTFKRRVEEAMNNYLGSASN